MGGAGSSAGRRGCQGGEGREEQLAGQKGGAARLSRMRQVRME